MRGDDVPVPVNLVLEQLPFHAAPGGLGPGMVARRFVRQPPAAPGASPVVAGCVFT
jgi:hypothetical protein